MQIVLSGLTVVAKLQLTISTFRRLRRDDLALISALVCPIRRSRRRPRVDKRRSSISDTQLQYVELCVMDLGALPPG